MRDIRGPPTRLRTQKGSASSAYILLRELGSERRRGTDRHTSVREDPAVEDALSKTRSIASFISSILDWVAKTPSVPTARKSLLPKGAPNLMGASKSAGHSLKITIRAMRIPQALCNALPDVPSAPKKSWIAPSLRRSEATKFPCTGYGLVAARATLIKRGQRRPLIRRATSPDRSNFASWICTARESSRAAQSASPLMQVLINLSI